MPAIHRITPCLWFDREAEEAAGYAGIFPNSRIGAIARYGEAGREFHRQAPGTVMTVAFELDGVAFTALNAGPVFKFNEAVSFQVQCDTQSELDRYWRSLSDGGDEQAQQCGWLKDRYGLSWQVVPSALSEMMSGDAAAAGRVMTALMRMKQLDLAELQRAHAG